MIALNKVFIGIGALGVTGLSAWGVYYSSSIRTIGDKLSREGLKILNLDKSNNEDLEAWKQKIESHKSTDTQESDKKALKIGGLSFASESDKDTENINKFKDACQGLLSASLDVENSDLKEKQAKEWCTKA